MRFRLFIILIALVITLPASCRLIYHEEPSDRNDIINTVNDYIRKEEYEKALIVSQKLPITNKCDYEYYFLVGRIKHLSADNNAAAKMLIKSLECKNDNISALNELAVVYENMGETEKAIEIYRSILKDHPDNCNSAYNISVIYKYLRSENINDYLTQAKKCARDNHYPLDQIE